MILKKMIKMIKKLTKKNSKAFSLVELLVTLAISSILFGSLMAFLYAVQKGASSYYRFMADDKVINISNYIFRDFSGAFVLQYDPDDKNYQDKSKKILVKDCFECTTDSEGQLQEIRFITNNSLPVYNGNPSRINRVIYKLEKVDDFFKLMRSKDLALSEQNSPTFYPMLEQIKDCKIKLYKKIENQNGETDLKIETNWSANKIYQDDNKKNKTIDLLPQQISFLITTLSDQTFEFLVPIFGYFLTLDDSDFKQDQKKEDQSTDNKSSQMQGQKENSKKDLVEKKSEDAKEKIPEQVKGQLDEQPK
jgi:prepilin-type N-terminal cleavage/methylation domain-containing protein